MATRATRSLRSVMRIDHVILASADLDETAARLEAEHGLRSVPGGRHVGIGTHNRIVPLGAAYLEILAVADADEAARSDIGRALSARLAQGGDGLMAWAVAVEDVRPVAERLGTEVRSIERQGLTARLTGVREAMATPFLPFFIVRDPGVADPGVADRGSGGVGGIEWIELAGDGERLSAWLDGAELPVGIVDGPPAIRAVRIGGRVIR
jgi:Glyoxalase-like domain